MTSFFLHSFKIFKDNLLFVPILKHKLFISIIFLFVIIYFNYSFHHFITLRVFGQIFTEKDIYNSEDIKDKQTMKVIQIIKRSRT